MSTLYFEIIAKKSLYEGKRVELIDMPLDPHPINPGARGTCTKVDDAGQLVVKWDNGRTLSLIPGIDKFKVLEGD